MNIEELITDLRARVNPQYYDQPGTESYERQQCVMALESLLALNDVLREENERLRKDAERMNGDIADLRQLIARYRERELTMGWNQE